MADDGDQSVLVVGCGGLGCELLKILAVTSRARVVAVDEDTVDMTNLNRQFFFVESDIGLSKAEVAAKKLRMLRGSETVTGVFASILSYKKIEFYTQFHVVYNCVDNNETRSFVNRMCVLANVELVDGGSAGWLGQAFCSKNSRRTATECFDCTPKREQEHFPVCTIRQRPKNFKHCLVWARESLKAEERGDEEEEEEKKTVYHHRPSSEEETDTNGQQSLDYDKEKTNRVRDKGLVAEEHQGEEREYASAKDSPVCKKTKAEKGGVREESSEAKEVDTCVSTELIYSRACQRAKKFSISPMSLMESETFLKQIVPSICTTNALVASLMILSKVKKKTYYLVQSPSRFVQVDRSQRRAGCLTCAVPVFRCTYSNESVGYFLEVLGADSLVASSRYFSLADKTRLEALDGEYGLALKDGLHYGVYFEKGDAWNLRRIR